MKKLIKNIMAGGKKPLVEPPRDWDKRQGGTKSFEVISPCSDISNPSDFNRVRYNKNSRQYQLAQNNGQTLSKSRRGGDYNPHQLPRVAESRRSRSTGGSSDGDIVAPGAFYFPTKESERRAEKLAKRESQKNDGKVAFKRTNGHHLPKSRSNKNNMKAIRSLARKTSKKMMKKKDAVQRAALAIGRTILEESRNKIIHDKKNQLERRKPSASLRSRRRSEQIERGVLQSSTNRRDVPLNKFKNDKMIVRAKSADNMNRHQNQMNASATLHQADVYFDRLSLTAGENHGASPFVRRGDADNRITSILESTSKTPQNRTRRAELDSPIDTPVSDLFSANDSLPNMRNNEYLATNNINSSPVSSLMLFYSKSGPVETTPKSHSSELESLEERRHRIIAKASRESDASSLYTDDSKSYKKAHNKDQKLLAHRNLQKDSYGLNSNGRAQQKLVKARKISKPEIEQRSKLESLFRPILPALSTDDARSADSYDPYEIRVTESAPAAMQVVTLGFRRKNSTSTKNSVVSLDSQQRHPSSPKKTLLANQARNNAEFLFANDYGPLVIDGKKVDRDDASISISTTSSRSRGGHRAGHRVTQKGENDDMSYSSRSTRSERRVRFSEGSRRTRLQNKRGDNLDSKEHPFDEAEKFPERIDERDEEESEEEEVPQERFVKEESRVKYNKFESNVKRIPSVDESIDRPQVETKLSNVTDNDSPRSIQSDERTAVTASSVHWTKTQTGVTPFVRGKSTAEPTRSPLRRYRNAQTKFNTQKSADESKLSPRKTKSPKRSPKRSPSKSPAKMLRKGSGGLVSMRINELNSRVSEVRKLNRMRKKNMNPRLHTHNFDNTQPVRSRALINYKTDSATVGKRNEMMAAKFNSIPVYEDDETTVVSYAHSKSRNIIAKPRNETLEDDDTSKMSEITGATFGTVRTVRQQRDSVSTVKQQRDPVSTVRQQRNALASIHQNRQRNSADSSTSRTTASSGFRNVKKQMFRPSDGTNSINTSLSAMMYKENSTAPQKTTLAPPVNGTPAMKWRTLAAAAAEKDALKMSATKPKKKASGLREVNVNSQYAVYGFKD